MGISTDVSRIVEDRDLIEPVELLTALTNGIDLRKISIIYEWVLAFEEENGCEPPDEFEFDQLKNLIKQEGRYTPVSLADSLTAQKSLMEYLHSKKKSVDVKTNSTSDYVTPLKPREVKRFQRIFNKKC